MQLSGKVALITGTGGGQGRAAALLFARAGATVVGCDINNDAQQDSIEFLAKEGLTLHGTTAVDLGNPAQVEAWIKAAATEHGRIDILYNNASAAKFGPIGEFSIDDWHYTIRNELDQVFYTTRFAWQHLSVNGGVIINIASTAAWGGSRKAGIAAHCATKGAIVSFTRQLAVEGASSGIRAVSISPGFIKTPGTAAFVEDPVMRKAILDKVLLDRPGEPEEIAAMALFIASDSGAFITGSDILIDGGMLAT